MTIIPARYITKVRQGREYRFDTQKNLFFNDITQKWCKNPIVKDEKIQSKHKQLFHPDIDEVITKYSLNYQLAQSARFFLFVIYDCINRKRIYNRDRDSQKEISLDLWMTPQDIYRIFGKKFHKEACQMLIDKKVIIKETRTSKRGKLYVYKFQPDFDFRKVSLNPITSEAVEKRIINYYIQRNKLLKCDKLAKFTIQDNQTLDFTREQVELVYENRWIREKHDCTYEQYMNSMEEVWTMINLWNTGDDNYKLASMNIRCEFGQRFHYFYTRIASELRPLIDEYLKSWDTVNSQPAILASLLSQFEDCPDDDPFIKAVSECRIYEDAAKKWGCTRKEAKPRILKAMYCRATSKAMKVIEELSPYAYKKMVEMKTQEFDDEGNYIPYLVRHKELSKKMQREESRVWRKIWNTLIDNGYHILPLHDSVYIKGNISNEELRYARRTIVCALRREFNIPILIEEIQYHNGEKVSSKLL